MERRTPSLTTLLSPLAALVLCAPACSDSDDSVGDNGNGNGNPPSARPDPCRGIELPASEHYVAPDLCARAVAVQQGRLRQIEFARNGDLIGVRASGEIVRYRDSDDNGMFDGANEIVVIADTGGNGNNATFDSDEGYLYAGSPDGVVRWPYSADAATLGEPEPVVVDQPADGNHTLHTVRSYDGWLYVHSGSEGNASDPNSPDYDTNRSLLKRFNLADFEAGSPWTWSEGSVYALGLRNMVGFARNADGEMYGVVNGLDNLMYGGQDVHNNNPGEDVVLLQEGQTHGYPYCFTSQNIMQDGTRVAPGTQLATGGFVDAAFTNPHTDDWCQQNATPPVSFLPAHSAPLDITFYEDGSVGGLPSAWVGDAFISQHGSWNTTPSVGHSVVVLPLGSSGEMMPSADGSATDFPHTVVFGGGTTSEHSAGTWGWSAEGSSEDPVRPVGVAISPVDGALYVASDNAGEPASGGEPSLDGVLYRIGLPLD